MSVLIMFTPKWSQSRIESSRFIFDNADMLTAAQQQSLEDFSKYVFLHDAVRVIFVSAGEQSGYEAVRSRERVMHWAKSGSVLDNRAELYPPAIVIYAYQTSKGYPAVTKEWSSNFWYAHWNSLPTIAKTAPDNEYLYRFTLNIDKRARYQTELHSWRRRFVPHGFVLLILFTYLCVTVYWAKVFCFACGMGVLSTRGLCLSKARSELQHYLDVIMLRLIWQVGQNYWHGLKLFQILQSAFSLHSSCW